MGGGDKPLLDLAGSRMIERIALWSVARGELRRLLSTPGRRDVGEFASLIGMCRIDFPAPKWDPFLNTNTPEDLAAARAIAEWKT
jgi:molybdenum cofactor guanylyltransferase